LRSIKCSIVWVYLILLTGVADAQVDPTPNGVGIYADLEATSAHISADVGVSIEVYLLLTRPHQAVNVVGWECDLAVSDNVAMWGFALPAEAELGAMVVDALGYQGAFSNPLPPTDIVVLMRFIIFLIDSEPAEFYILPNGRDSSGSGLPCFGSFWYGDVQLHDMHPYQQSDGKPAFKVNDTITPVVCASWGEIKALYGE